MWTAKPELGRKLRQRLSMVFKWAVAADHIATNPAGEALAGVLPRRAGNGGHFDSLPASEVPAALDTIDASAAFWSTKAAIRMLALTATRSSEVRGMRWDEIDGNVWTIPADRTKTAKPQRAPLSSAALALLQQARTLSGGSGYVFPNRHGRQTTVEALSKLCRDLGLAMTPHGLRSSFRSWCAEQGINREVAEMSLGHTVRGVEGAYQRSDLLEARAEVMEQWGQHLSGKSDHEPCPRLTAKPSALNHTLVDEFLYARRDSGGLGISKAMPITSSDDRAPLLCSISCSLASVSCSIRRFQPL